MKVITESKNLYDKITELLVVGTFEDEHLEGSLLELDKKLDGSISELMLSEEFEGKFGQTSLIHTNKKISPKRVLILGLGKKSDLTLLKLGQMAGTASKYVRNMKLKEFTSSIYGLTNKINYEDVAHVITEWSILGQYKFNELKSENKEKEIEYLTLLTDRGHDLEETINGAVIEAHSTNYARTLANTPANIATTDFIADRSKQLAKELNIDCKVYDTKELEKMGMNALLGVGQGSKYTPKLIVLDYNPPIKHKTVAVTGKTIVFDSGGISIKPSQKMSEMKFDKCGGCMTLGIVKSVAEQNLPVRLIGILGVAENMPGGNAQRPGDVVTSSSGQTIEIINTDAEGRLVLSDALDHATSFNPDVIVNLATLTGAVQVALGKLATGLFGNNEKMNTLMKQASDIATERVWELPTWDDYNQLIESDIADMKNHNENRQAGSIVAAMFLKKFVKNKPWIHLDIASTSWDSDKPYMFNGSTGFGVRLVTEFIKKIEKED